MGNNESSDKLIVSNDSGGDAYIILTPTKNFPLEKYFSNDFGLSKLWEAGLNVKNVADLYNEWTVVKRSIHEKDKISAAILNFFTTAGLLLPLGRARDLYDQALCNPLHYLSAYGWGVLETSEEICVTLLIKYNGGGDLKMAQFRTLANWSWVVNTTCVTLTKGKSLWEKRLASGYPLVGLNVEED